MEEILRGCGPYVLALIVLVYNSKMLGYTKTEHEEQKKQRAFQRLETNLKIKLDVLNMRRVLQSKSFEITEVNHDHVEDIVKEIRVIEREEHGKKIQPGVQLQVPKLNERITELCEHGKDLDGYLKSHTDNFDVAYEEFLAALKKIEDSVE